MVFGITQIVEMDARLHCEFEMLGTHSMKKMMIPILRRQQSQADIVLKVTNASQKELPGELEKHIIQVFGPFAAVPDNEGLFSMLKEMHPGTTDTIVVTCLDRRYIIDCLNNIVTHEEITLD